MGIRIFFATDVHGATAVWQKWIKAAEVYDANVLMLCGDLTGKTLVPLIKTTNNNFTAHYFGKEWQLKTETEIIEFEKRLENIGTYFARLSQDEVEELKNNGSKVENLIQEKMIERIDKWLGMLITTVNTSKIKVIVMPGNDDSFAIDDVIQQYEKERVINPLDRIVELNGVEIISLAHVPPTPWNTPREADEKKIDNMIKGLIKKRRETKNSIFNLHISPYGKRLDLAPQSVKDRKPIIMCGQVNVIHVGSKAFRKAIEKHQPILGLHGHIHESSGAEKIGRTLIVNPGSEYSEGVLRAFVIIDVSPEGFLNYWRVEG